MLATVLLSAASLYLKIGLVVALVFAAVVGRLDPAARGAFGFRPLILPGVVLLWPLVLVRSAWLLRARRSS